MNMKCGKCGAEWKVDANRSSSLKLCPFCQESLETEKTSGWKFFDNTKELLAFIAAEYGNDALFGRKHFSDHSAPLMPQGQKNLVKQAYDCGAVKTLQDNMNSDQPRKEIAVRQAVGKLIDDYGTSEDIAKRVIWEFTNAIGWGMPEPQSQSTSAPSQPVNVSTPPLNPSPSSDTEAGKLLTRAWLFAEDGDWKDATDYFNKVLDAEPTYAPAYLGLICVDLQVPNEAKLANFKDPGNIINHKHYKRAVTDPAIKSRLESYVQIINTRIDAEQKAAAAEAERKRKTAEKTARKNRVQDQFDNALKIMSNAQNPDDYRKAISAFGNIDSNYQDINSQIKAKTAECEKKKAAIEAAFQQKYGFLLDRYSAEGRAQAESRRKAAQAKIDDENAKVKADIDAKCAQSQQKFDADHRAWQEEVVRLKAQYEPIYRKWEVESNAIRTQAESWKSQGLCPHCGGTLKGFIAKKCIECGKSPSDTIITPTAPQQPNYPNEPKLPQMPTFTPRRLDPDVNAGSSDIEAYINGNEVFVKSGEVIWRVVSVQGSKALLHSEKGDASLEDDSIKRLKLPVPSLIRSKCDFAFYVGGTSDSLQCFGFYADGTVITQGVGGSHSMDTFRNVVKWFNKTNNTISKGRYSYNESTNKIDFSSTSSSGTVDYEGIMDSQGVLQLNWHSRINNRSGKESCKYIGGVKNGQLS
jgi:hypothetical protein